jgi:hypothetical protein
MITSPVVFFGAGGALLTYLLYMMIRKRKGERHGAREHEAEL